VSGGAVVWYNSRMATTIYDSAFIELIDGTEVYITPLKIKYLREFMEAFELVKSAEKDEDSMRRLSECARIAMKQYYPLIKTVEDLEDSVDLSTVYKIVDIAAGIKISEKKDEPVRQQAAESGTTWEDLDLAKLESEIFLIGIWKDYEDLESSLSMPEMIATIGAKRELDYQEKKFMAAIQGVDLDKETRKSDPWEEMKARVFSGGQASNSGDVVSLQGVNAQRAGFGIGMGLEYEDLS